jgi:hypothetical protein
MGFGECRARRISAYHSDWRMWAISMQLVGLRVETKYETSCASHIGHVRILGWLGAVIREASAGDVHAVALSGIMLTVERGRTRWS